MEEWEYWFWIVLCSSLLAVSILAAIFYRKDKGEVEIIQKLKEQHEKDVEKVRIKYLKNKTNNNVKCNSKSNNKL